MSRRVLISGASISGLTASYWLSRHGFDVTVVEKAVGLRLGGQNIDISDAAVDVIRKMGLEEQIRDRHTGEKGLQFVDTRNEAKASFPVSAAGSLTKDIEIVRGDLVEILAGATADDVRYRFGETISSYEDRGDDVLVQFSSGHQEAFDILIAADGMNSATRAMIIGDGQQENYLGCWSSYFTIPRVPADNDWWRWYTGPNGVIAFLRPDNDGTMRASINFLSDEDKPPYLTLEDKKQRLRDRLEGAGWECDRIAAALEGVDDIFLGPLHQVKASSWSAGRAALAGDAAHCPTPYTGMGTTLAIIGAYVLAHELASHDRPEDAFIAYDGTFRAFAEKSQELPPGVPKLAYANSKAKVSLIHFGASIAASKPVQAIASLFGGKAEKANDFALPNYPEAPGIPQDTKSAAQATSASTTL